MNIYSFKDIKSVFVVGDCHGEFKNYFHYIKNGLTIKKEDEDKPHPKEIERQARKAALNRVMEAHPADINGRRYRMPPTFFDPTNNLKKTKKHKESLSQYSNSIFIIAGDCGIGFNKPQYYDDLFAKFNKILSYNNTFVIMIRGNHDDPSYFDGERINLSNIKAIPDYSVVNVQDKNILCVGGAISSDRTWRIKQEGRINRFSTTNKKKLYWENEAPVFNEEALNEITKSIKINYVISHTAPSFVNPESRADIDEWSMFDETLVSDIKEERKVLDKVFETLRDHDMKPEYWAYGHFNMNFIERRSGTLFRCLNDGFNPVIIDMDIFSFTQNEMLTKKMNKEKKISIGKKLDEQHVFDFNNFEGVELNFGTDEENTVQNEQEAATVANIEERTHDNWENLLERFNNVYAANAASITTVADATTTAYTVQANNIQYNNHTITTNE